MFSSLFSSPSAKAAVNALLAEHCLNQIELVPENPQSNVLRIALKNVFRSAGGAPYDDEYWVNMFNAEDRTIQLNLVAMALNELGQHPSVQRTNWRQVANPLVLHDVRQHIVNARAEIARKYGPSIALKSGKLKIFEWGLGEDSYQSVHSQEEDSATSGSPAELFMIQLPDSDANVPNKVYQFGRFTIMYYENAKTIGEVLGIPNTIVAPLVAVVTVGDSPHCLYRIEQSLFGTSMMCKLEPNGMSLNYGPFDLKDKSKFLARIEELIGDSKL